MIYENSIGQLASSGDTVQDQPAKNKKHVEVLSFLRALAALSVCLYHYTGAVLPKLRDERIGAFFQDGWLGVDVFFVISGFIIPYSLLGKNYEINNFFSYMKKRVVRINPPAYIAMLLVLLQGYLIDYFIAHRIVYTANVSLGQIVNNIFFIIPFSKYKWVVGIFWTLAIEFQFYILIGLLFSLLFENKKLYPFFLIFLLLGAMQYLPFQSNENIFRFSSLFAMGGVTLLYYVKRISLVAYLASLGLFVVAAYFELSLYMSLTGLFTALCISFIKIKNKVFDFLGNISYSFYLLHALIGTTCEFFLIKIIDPTSIFNKLLMLGICLVAAIAGSYIFYELVEKRCMIWATKKSD